MRKYLLLLAFASLNFYWVQSQQVFSQTKTATLFNNISESYLNMWDQSGVQYFSADDNSFAFSKKLAAKRSALFLVLRGFGFTIPSGATIEHIVVTARRYKTGKGTVKDYFASLLRNSGLPGDLGEYGIRWTDPTNYPGIESEVTYTENGSGITGQNQTYQWTAEMINDPKFGVRIENAQPKGGAVVIYYDLVQITVEYSTSTQTHRTPGTDETKSLKQPAVFPNPFTTKTNIQFTAAESGNAVVELFNVNGTKVRTLFSGNVIQGQAYNVAAGDAQLPKGIYVYMINNGRKRQTGRIMKLQ